MEISKKPQNSVSSMGLKDIAKVGKQGVAVKMPKPKKPENPFGPQSKLMGKSESNLTPKHSSTRKLWDFINKKHKNK